MVGRKPSKPKYCINAGGRNFVATGEDEEKKVNCLSCAEVFRVV